MNSHDDGSSRPETAAAPLTPSEAATPTTPAGDDAHTHVLLLRGVNVGGRNKVPKAELAALAEEAGATEVSVYLNSGNVLCRIGGESDRAVGGMPAATETASGSGGAGARSQSGVGAGPASPSGAEAAVVAPSQPGGADTPDTLAAPAVVAERLRALLAERLDVTTSVHVAEREELSGLLDALVASELCTATDPAEEPGEEHRALEPATDGPHAPGARDGLGALDDLDPKRVHLVLFDRAPSSGAAATVQDRAFQAATFGDDRCVIVGRGVWIRYAADSHSSRLTLPRLERLLSEGAGSNTSPSEGAGWKVSPSEGPRSAAPLVGTARNLRTVRVLAGRPEPKIDLPALPPRP